MRTRFFVVASTVLTAVFAGCGPPEAEFSWNERTEDLLPKARKAVHDAVTGHFGTPAKMEGWQRLPIEFGGAAGTMTSASRDDDSDLVTELTIDFKAPAVLVKYDHNLDGMLTVDELPTDLQKLLSEKVGSKTLLERADADGDKILTADDLKGVASRLPDEWQKLLGETANPVNDETAADYVGKELVFVTGNYAKQKTAVQSFVNAKKGVVKIWPPLTKEPENGGSPVEVVLDFGGTLRSGRHLYMHHCMHCHGVTGNGDGPTAKYLNPLPRDYRQGIFKFTSTARKLHPQREDLARILRHGIPGTYMPSFSMLTETEAAHIIEYVRWLSMRGRYEIDLDTQLALQGDVSNTAVEKRINQEMASYEAAVKDKREVEKVTPQSIRSEVEKDLADILESFPEMMDTAGTQMADKWRESQRIAAEVYPKIARTPDGEASRARGRVLFLEKCAVCHGTTAEGNGPQTKDYGEDPITKEKYKEPGLFDDWGHPIQPRNLTLGIYRGGRRPVDIYRRVHEGIPGTPMASFSTFKDEQIWDIVNYVLSIPYGGAVDQFEKTKVARSRPAAEEIAALKPAVAGKADSADAK